jgi:hypothetical protein
MSSFLERLNQMRIELAQRDADPLRDKVEATVRGLEAISSAALLDPLGRKNTAGNRRQIAPTMRLLGLSRSSHAASSRAASVAPKLVAGHDPSANSEIGPPQRNPFRRRRASTKGD